MKTHGNNNFILRYESRAIRDDIPNLPKFWKEEIKKAIDNKLTTHPGVYGKPLRGSLKGYFKLRVGDYRVIFRVNIKTKEVFIDMIQHRSRIYKESDRKSL